MPKNRIVCLMEWPVANTKTRRKKTTKTIEMAIKISILIFLKNYFEILLLLSHGTTIPKIRIPGQIMWTG